MVDTAFADFWSVLRVNLGSAFLASRAAARLMIARQAGGAIVNLGSIFGQQGVAGGAGYCASKAAVALLTQSLALELAPHGIRVNTIAPGNMATEMHWDELRSRARASGTTFEEQVDLVARGVPLGRHGTGADIAGRGDLAGLPRRRVCHRADDRGQRWRLAQLTSPAGWPAAGPW